MKKPILLTSLLIGGLAMLPRALKAQEEVLDEFRISNRSIDIGESITLTNRVSTADSIHWRIPDHSSEVISGTSANYSLSAAGYFTVEHIAYESGISDTTRLEEFLRVHDNTQIPIAKFRTTETEVDQGQRFWVIDHSLNNGDNREWIIGSFSIEENLGDSIKIWTNHHGSQAIAIRVTNAQGTHQFLGGMQVNVIPQPEWRYADTDGDSFGDDNNKQLSVEPIQGFVADNTDCDDTDSNKFPGQNWYQDSDGDGLGNGTQKDVSCEGLLGWVLNNGDCNDSDDQILGKKIYFTDNDRDGFGDESSTIELCETFGGPYSLVGGDCNDFDFDEKPGAIWYVDADGDGYGFGEEGDEIAQCTSPGENYVTNNYDCDDTDNSSVIKEMWFYDGDGDGTGDSNPPIRSCVAPENYVRNFGDCDDTDASVQQDRIWYADTDGDGFGSFDSGIITTCQKPDGYSESNTDCDDSDAGIIPSKWYSDVDNDGFGSADDSLFACAQPANYVENNTDCDDSNDQVQDGNIWYADTDGDGLGDLTSSLKSCETPQGYVGNSNDCDDTNVDNQLPISWYYDEDGDSFGSDSVLLSCVQPVGFVSNSDDCDDENASTTLLVKYYRDQDLDDRGDPNYSQDFCSTPGQGWVLNSDDCINYSPYYQDCQNLPSSIGNLNNSDFDIYEFHMASSEDGHIGTVYTVWDKEVEKYQNLTRFFGPDDQPTSPIINLGTSTSGEKVVAILYIKQGRFMVFYEKEGSNKKYFFRIYHQSGAIVKTETEGVSEFNYQFKSPVLKPNGEIYVTTSSKNREIDVLDNNGSFLRTILSSTNLRTFYQKIAFAKNGKALVTYTKDQSEVRLYGVIIDENDQIVKEEFEISENLNYNYLMHDSKSVHGFFYVAYEKSVNGLDQTIFKKISQEGETIETIQIIYGGPNFVTEPRLHVTNDENLIITYKYFDLLVGNAYNTTLNKFTSPFTVSNQTQLFHGGQVNDNGIVNAWMSSSVKNETGISRLPLKKIFFDGNEDDNADSPVFTYLPFAVHRTTENFNCSENIRWFADTDQDGFGDINSFVDSCLLVEGYVLDSSDCNDSDKDITLPEVWFADIDNDGIGNTEDSIINCIQPQGYVLEKGDCDDQNPSLLTIRSYYKDFDGDGVGNINEVIVSCTPLDGYVLEFGDCNDWNAELIICEIDEKIVTSDPGVERKAKVALAENGKSVVAYEIKTGVEQGVYVRFYDKYLTPETEGIKVNALNTTRVGDISVRFMNESTIVVSWQYWDGDDIFAMKYRLISSTGEFLSNEFVLNSSRKSYSSGLVSNSINNEAIGLWGIYDLYLTKFNSSGEIISSDKPVGNVVRSSNLKSIVTNDANHTMVLYRGSNGALMSRVFDANLDAIGAEFQVGTVAKNSGEAANVSAIENGFLVVWDESYETGSGRVFYQEFTNDGTPIQATKTEILSEEGSTFWRGEVATNSTLGIKAIAGRSNYELVVKVYDNSFELLDEITLENNFSPEFPDLSINNAGELVIVWRISEGIKVDKIVLPLRYLDADGDGYGDVTKAYLNNDVPNLVGNSTDCDDNNASVNERKYYYADLDGDGLGSKFDSIFVCTSLGGYVDNSNDCNDDDPLNEVLPLWYADADEDGYGNPDESIRSCTIPVGYVRNSNDCADTSATIGLGNVFYRDADNDGLGNALDSIYACTKPDGYIDNSNDCNDSTETIRVIAPRWYKDIDNDGYGDPNTAYITSCSILPGYVRNDDDCEPNNPIVGPCGDDVPTAGYDQNFLNEKDPAIVMLDAERYAVGYSVHSVDLNNHIEVIREGGGGASDVINFNPMNNIWQVDLDREENGDFIAVWNSTGAITGTLLQRYSKAGFKKGLNFYVNNAQATFYPSIDIRKDGKFAVAYTEQASLVSYVQKYQNDGTKDGSRIFLGNGEIMGLAYAPNGVIGAALWNNSGNEAVAKILTESNLVSQSLGFYDFVDHYGDVTTNANSEFLFSYRLTAEDGTFLQKVSNDGSLEGSPIVLETPGGKRIADVKFSKTNEHYFAMIGKTDSDIVANIVTWDQQNWNSTWNTIMPNTPSYLMQIDVLENSGVAVAWNEKAEGNTIVRHLKIGTSTYYQDADGDGFGNPNVAIATFNPRDGYVSNNLDCDDGDADSYLGTKFFADSDNDGYGDVNNFQLSCILSEGFVIDSTDCNDSDSLLNAYTVWFADSDGDGYGDVNDSVEGCDPPARYVQNNEDCDDRNDQVFPQNWYADVDADGYGDRSELVRQCDRPVGYINNFSDCDDSNDQIHPNLIWYLDEDGDGYGTADSSTTACRLPYGFSANREDCNDKDSLFTEIVTWYIDADADGFGDINQTIDSCGTVQGYVTNSDDCDDRNDQVHPNAMWYADADADGYGDSSDEITACRQPDGYVSNATDCDDSRDEVSPEKKWYLDEDGDHYGDIDTFVLACINPTNHLGNYVDNSDDCDDSNYRINPFGAWYLDADGDGFGGFGNVIRTCIQPEGYVLNSDDCDDDNSAIHPNTIWYADADGDGFGSDTETTTSCDQVVGYVSNRDDCNDADVSIHPSTPWYADGDNDGYGTSEIVINSCEQPIGFVGNDGDCDDRDDSVNPELIWYADNDGDGFGNRFDTQTDCRQPEGYVVNDEDCNDSDASVNPNKVWYYDADVDGFGIADSTIQACSRPQINYSDLAGDCDDGNQEVNPFTTWNRDADGDGFGDRGNFITGCRQPEGYVISYLAQDCDDSDPLINPETVWYLDEDGDGYGSIDSTVQSCLPVTGYVSNSDDCNDADLSINPTTLWYADGDNDGYGATDVVINSCEQPIGYVGNNEDCNDRDASINPGLIWFADTDQDGFGDLNSTLTDCRQPEGYVDNNEDCNDTDASVTPETTWFADVDADGFGDVLNSTRACEQPIGFVINNEDCDDSNASLNPTTIWYQDLDNDGYGDANVSITDCRQPNGYVLEKDAQLNVAFNILEDTIYSGANAQFSDASIADFGTFVSWKWIFESIVDTAEIQNPSITFDEIGEFTIKLIATHENGQVDSVIMVDALVVETALVPPVAKFSNNSSSILRGGQINFTNASENDPTSYLWTFEGGTPETSTEENPSVTYLSPGEFNVTLVVSNSDGTNTLMKENEIVVTDFTYCTSTTSDTRYEYIKVAEIGSYSRLSDREFYSMTTADLTLEKGGNYPIEIQVENVYAADQVVVWTDWNTNGTFDTDEKFQLTKNGATFTGNISIPGSAVAGVTRFRIRLSDGTQPACGSNTYGEVEDYAISIVDPRPSAPIAAFEANVFQVAPGQSINFTDVSTNLPTAWDWFFEGAETTVSTSQNPVVVYNTPGVYKVSLRVSNAIGIDQEEKLNYITVSEESITYCNAKGNSSTYEWIDRVQFADIDHSSGNNNGYGDHTSIRTDVEKGQSYTLTVTPGFLSENYSEGHFVWIDFDRNGTYEASEQVMTKAPTKNVVSESIAIPSDARTGVTGMRVMMVYDRTTQDVCSNFTYGEAEDYKINILEAGTVGPKLISNSNIELKLLVYPNPSNGTFRVNLSYLPEDVQSLTLMDINGRIIETKAGNSVDNLFERNELEAGVYIVQLTTLSNRYTTKVIIK